MKGNYIYALELESGTTKRFTNFVWDRMGATRKKFRQVSAEEATGRKGVEKGNPEASAAAKEVKAAQARKAEKTPAKKRGVSRKTLVDKAGAAKKQGDLQGALRYYEQANRVKVTARVTKTIQELKAKIDESKEELPTMKAHRELVSQAKSFIESGDLDTAKELLSEAAAIKGSTEINELLEEIKSIEELQ